MYGLSRTLVKVRGQYHMVRRFERLPASTGTERAGQTFGLIGCGNYAFSNIAYYLKKEFGAAIRACMDIDGHRAASLALAYRVPRHSTDPHVVLEDTGIRLVFIASNHSSHTEYAIQALQAGKSVYIEKPHAVSMEQLRRLLAAYEASPGQMYLGYNRPGSRFGQLITAHMAQESGPSVINWFVAGHEIDPDHWYFRPEEGGRVLGNLCHWTDFTLEMAGPNAFPVHIRPARHERSDCNIAVSYVFANGTVSCITFSAKGHAFEGVMERLSVHRGNCILTMDDYRVMTVRLKHHKKRYLNLFRDHGHQRNIIHAARLSIDGTDQDRRATAKRAWLSGILMLATKEALENAASATLYSDGTIS